MSVIIALPVFHLLAAIRTVAYSHSQQPRHHGAKAIKHIAICEGHEIIQEGCYGEDEGELLILTATV